MKRNLTAALLSSTFALSMMFGQGPGGGPPDPATMVQRRVEMLTDLLTLTAAQQTQATSIFTASTAAETTARTSLQAAQKSLGAAIQSNSLSTIDQVSATIGNLTAQLTATDAKANAALYQILTPDQQTKLNTTRGGRGMMGGGGPGAPGGFGRRPPQ